MIIIEAYKYSIKNSLLINPVAENKKRILANMSLRNKTLLTKRKNSSKAVDNNVKAMTLDIMNTEFIINFLDNLIMNKFKILIIDEEFFQEEQNLLKIFTEFLVEFKEIKFKINLYEEDDSNINEFGRFDDLKKTIDIDKAKEYFEKIENREVPIFEVNLKIDKLLRKFIIDGNLE